MRKRGQGTDEGREAGGARLRDRERERQRERDREGHRPRGGGRGERGGGRRKREIDRGRERGRERELEGTASFCLSLPHSLSLSFSPSLSSHPALAPSALSLVDCESVDHRFSPLHSTQDPRPPPHGFPSGGGAETLGIGAKGLPLLGLTASTPRPCSPHRHPLQTGRAMQASGAEGRGAQVHRTPTPTPRAREGGRRAAALPGRRCQRTFSFNC